jgi:carboxyl-terminal processing protease
MFFMSQNVRLWAPRALLLFLAFTGLASFAFADATSVAADDSSVKAPPPSAANDYRTTREMRLEVLATAMCLQHGHILQKKLDSLDAKAFIRDYLGNLDALHLFYLNSRLKFDQERFGSLLDIYFSGGNLLPAFEIYKEFLKNVDDRVAWINERLTQPFDFGTDETIVIDRRKQDWPETREAADKLWEKRLTLDIIIELLGEEKKLVPSAVHGKANAPSAAPAVPPEAITAERLADATARVRKRYNKIQTYLRLEAHEVQEIYLNTLASQYDPHTTFFTRQSNDEFEIAMRNKLIGVGAVLQDEDGYCIVKEILPGGPIEASKRIRVGDRITAIGQGATGELEDIIGMRLNKIVSRLRGKANTTVRLRIEPAADHTARYTLELQRSEIKLTTKLAQATLHQIASPDGKRTVAVGVIELPAFYGKGAGDSESGSAYSTTEDVAELIKKLKAHNIQGLILDLRRNGGGLLDEAVRLTGLFIPDGPVVQIRDAKGKLERLDVPSRGASSPHWDGPLAILVSKLSASASEIVAGALQDHRRALIIGDANTHGKGTVQKYADYAAFDRNLGSAIKFTVQKWYLPSGKSIQLKGVAADITIPSIYSALPLAESDLDRPLAWDSIGTILEAGPTPPFAVIAPELIERLRVQSDGRQKSLPEFHSHNRSIAWTKSREKNRPISINYATLRAERIADRALRESIRETYKKLEGTNTKVETIKLDSALGQEKKSPPNETAAPESNTPASDAETGDEDEPWPDIDVQLRESIRILGDWLAVPEKRQQG